MNADPVPSAPAAAPRTARTQLLFVAVGLLAGACGGGVPPPPHPRQPERLSPALRALLGRELEQVRAEPGDARARAELALAYAVNRQWAEARASYRQAAALDRNEPLWPYHAALARLAAGDVPGATGELRRLAERFPDFAPGLHRLGDLELEHGELERARAAFERVAEIEPDAPEGHAALGDALLHAGDPEGALAALERALALDPGYRPARYVRGLALARLGRTEEAQRELELGIDSRKRLLADRWSERAPFYSVVVESRLEAALEWMESGRLERAYELLARTREEHPDDLRTLVNLGVAALRTGRVDEARTALEEAARRGSAEPMVFLNLAGVQLAAGRAAEALGAAERARSLGADEAACELARGRALVALGRGEEARRALARAAELDRADPRAARELARLALAAGEPESARRWLVSLAERQPDDWGAHADLARVALELGDLELAAVALGEARALAPGEPRLAALARELAARRKP